jgi:hypothetical protein
MAQSGNVLQSGTASSDASANNQTSVTAGSRSSAYGNISNQRVNATGGRSSSNSRATGGTGGSATATGGSGTGGSATARTGSSNATAGNVTINNLYGSDPSGSTGNGNLPASGQNATGAGTGTNATTDPAAANTFTDNVHYSGSQTIRNTPDAVAPALYGGTNPCSVGVSGGLGLPGFGISAGGTWSDRGCERRNGAVILFQANMPDVAVALLCQDSDMRTAFGSAGKPCPQERAVAARQAAAATSAPVQQAAAQPAPATTVAANTAQAGYRGPAPAWCSSPIKDATDRAYHTYYCR